MAVYFMQAGVSGPIKIGHTNGSLQKRMAALQTAHHDKLFLLACIDGSRADELALHKRFAKFRLHGEWFQASFEILDCVANPERIASQAEVVTATPSYESILRTMMARGQISIKQGEWFIQKNEARRLAPEEAPEDTADDWRQMREAWRTEDESRVLLELVRPAEPDVDPGRLPVPCGCGRVA
jgi:hypothetical protein